MPKDLSLLQAIAVDSEGNVDVLNDTPRVFAIAEEYANGAMAYLKEFIFENPADFEKKYANYIKKLL